jgi:hypothetical protein
MLPDGKMAISLAIHRSIRLFNDPLANLKTQFPLLADDVERTWQLALNRLKGLQTFRLFTFTESERRLDELLRVKVSEP